MTSSSKSGRLRSIGTTWCSTHFLNVRGINSDKKWNLIRDRILESNCEIACFQETNRLLFDLSFIRHFCPPFDSFEFLPSVDASGNSLIIWKSSSFNDNLVFQNNYATTIVFTLFLIMRPGS